MRLSCVLRAIAILPLLLSTTALAAAGNPQPVGRPQASAEPEPRFLPELDSAVRADEMQLLGPLLAALASGDDDAGSAVAALDSVLAKVGQPTTFRGMVQFFRAQGLLDLDRNAEAIEAIDESIRLLPGYSAPLLVAANVYAYQNQPGIGADYLLRASRIDPASVRKFDDYDVGNIMRRLAVARDEKRIGALADRLLEINWTGQELGSQSALAQTAIQRHVDAGNVAAARTLVPKLLVPAHAHALLIDNRYRSIWTDVEEWSGNRLQNLWRTYLNEARDRWSASQASTALDDYVGALSSARHYKTVIKVASPALFRSLQPDKDIELQPIFLMLGHALASEGNWKEIERMYDNAARAWPLGSDTNALNLEGNRARFLLSSGQAAKAEQVIDRVIADARRRGNQVNLDALSAMHQVRACALREVGRPGNAATSVARALAAATPNAAATLHICMGDIPAARLALLAGLKDETRRLNVLQFMQPSADDQPPSDYSKRLVQGSRELRSDPTLIAEAEKYGRILPYALEETAPPE